MAFNDSISFVSASASDSYQGNNPLFYILLGGVALLVTTLIAKRAKRRVDAVAGDSGDVFAVRIAPAPPFPQDVTRVRALLGVTSPEVRITRYTVPVVMADTAALTVKDKKVGEIIAIPSAAITEITAGIGTIKPKGTLGRYKFPSVLVHLAQGENTETITLTPVTGAYEKISQSQAEVLAVRLKVRLGLGQADLSPEASS